MMRRLFFLAVALQPLVGSARPPATMTLDEMLVKSDAVIIAQVKKVNKSNKYRDLSTKYFDEYAVVVCVYADFKGTLHRGDNATIIAYDFNGKGAPGNFGSTLRLFDGEKSKLHLLYLRKRGDTWTPTSGYVDAGNSHFVIIPSGFVFPLEGRPIPRPHIQ